MPHRNARNLGPRGPYDSRWHRLRDRRPEELTPEQKVGADLRTARLRQGHTQEQAAEIIGLKRARLARIENGSLGAPHRYYAADFIVDAYKAYLVAGAPPADPPAAKKRRRRA